MASTWRKVTGHVTVRRDDDGAVFQLDVISTFHEHTDTHGAREVEDRLKELASPDGRRVYSSDETHFYFEDEPTRALRIMHS